MSYTHHGDGIYSFGEFPVVVEFQETNFFVNNTKVITHSEGNEAWRIMSWGDRNKLCDEREELISENNIMPQLLKTQRNITMGMEIFTYREEKDENGKRKLIEVNASSEIQDVLDELEEDDYWEELTNDFVKNSMAHTLFVKNKKKKYGISTIKSRYMRPEEMSDDGIIRHYFRSGNWKDKKNVKRITSYKYAKSKGKYPNNFIHRIQDSLFGNEYFPIPTYWTGSKWIEIGNKIPELYAFSLENQYFTPLHIEIPKDYFYDGYSVKQQIKTEKEAREEEAAKRKAFLEQVDKALAGTKKSGKAIWSEYSISNLQKEYGGIKFNKLEIKVGDKSILDLFNKTNEANISGTGVHPSLAAIITQGGLSSGSEIRNALYMYIITQALIPRKQLLKPLYILGKLNGWDRNIKFGFRDVELTTTDANPKGQQSVTAK